MATRTTSLFLLGILLGAVLPGLWWPPALAAPPVPDRRFGVVEAYAAPNAATALGAGWTRVTFRWNEIQPNGPHEWNVAPISDQTLNHELAQGREVVGLLVATPGWATDWDAGSGVPRGLNLPVDHPENLWAGFVRTMVDRYAGRINHWIIWNEPDIAGTQHMSWGGSVADFVRLLQVGYTVAKKTNPDTVIHLAAVTHWWDEHWFGHLLNALAADPHAPANNHYFDVATLHVYFQPETVYDITAHYGGMMRGHGIHKPIWIAETNAAPSQDPAWPVPDAQFDVSLEQQAAYVVQAFSLAIAAGAERIAVYKMADTGTDRTANPEPFGLVRADGSRRPAFTAYQMAATYLAGFRGGTWNRRDTISLVTIDRGSRTTTVVWARGPEPQRAMIPARTTRALLVDVRGGARIIHPERGYYYLDLPPASCTDGCLIGGSPYMVVEEAPARSDTAPVPQSPSPSPTAEAAPQTSAQPPGAALSTPTLTPLPTVRPRSIGPGPTGIASAAGPAATEEPSSTASSTSVPAATSQPPEDTAPSSTPSPAPCPTVGPSLTPMPASASPTPLGHLWILATILVLGLAGAAVAVSRRI